MQAFLDKLREVAPSFSWSFENGAIKGVRGEESCCPLEAVAYTSRRISFTRILQKPELSHVESTARAWDVIKAADRAWAGYDPELRRQILEAVGLKEGP